MTPQTYVFYQSGYIPGIAAISPCSAGSIVTVDLDTMTIINTTFFGDVGDDGIKEASKEAIAKEIPYKENEGET